MEKRTKTNGIKWLFNILRHGLFLHGITNRLANIGILIIPYYWVQEGISDSKPPEIKENPSDYTLKHLGLEEVKSVCNKLPGLNNQEIIEGFNNGQLCVGLLCKDEIAAFMFIELNDFIFMKRKFKLKDNEAYLLNMWTFDSYRGKNLAPYLRYQSYLLLNEMGRNTPYSVSAYLNKSTLKFKQKLNAKNLKLYMFIELFKKCHWNFVIKNYSD
ncbi:MAG: hypothetical protein QM485_12805 [Flavobacteriaceae bacterium]